MSLLSEAMTSCVILDKRTTPDGYGGVITEWVDGAEFQAAIVKDSSIQALQAQQQGVTGVYTVSGMRLKFVPVNVLYSTEDFIICEQQVSEKTVLRLYDEVVVKGKGLYDGKVIS